jgi:Fe-S cluster assembly protein SufD
MNTLSQSASQWYRDRFDRASRGLSGGPGSRVHVLRRAALARFEELGFPAVSDEEWRFTNVSPIARTNFLPAEAPEAGAVAMEQIEPFLFRGHAGHRLVFVNGHYVAALSDPGTIPPGAVVESLASAIERHSDLVTRHLSRHTRVDENGFTALNAAFMQDGAFIHIPDNTDLPEAIHLLYVALPGRDPILAAPRNLFVVGRSSRVAIVESYIALGSGAYLTNVVSELVVGENATVEHDRLQLEDVRAYHVGTIDMYQQGNSTVTSNSISLGGSIVRNTVTAVLDAPGSTCTLNGLSLATGSQVIDNHTVIDHAKPHCQSHELYKAILDGTSRGVFNGKIFVRKDAQKTDAKQTNQTLLLSDDATIDTKPQLEIFADDVKCTHGATVGQLAAEQLFYLRARGIDDIAARDVLTFAFAADVIDRVHVEPLREQLDALLHTRLREGRIAG